MEDNFYFNENMEDEDINFYNNSNNNSHYNQ